MSGERWKAALPYMYVWWDYASIPQPTAVSTESTAPSTTDHRLLATQEGIEEEMKRVVAALARAVDSIPGYVEMTTVIFVNVPLATHVDTARQCNMASWRRRGWCRIEYQCALLARTRIPVILCSNRPLHCMGTHELLNLTAEGGDFTCCQKDHEFNGRRVDCDRPKCHAILTKMLEGKLAALWSGGHVADARALQAVRHLILRGLIPEEPATHIEEPVARLRASLAWEAESKRAPSLLHFAVMSDDAPAVRALLAARADCRRRVPRSAVWGQWLAGASPLHAAMACASWETVELLLGARADPRATASPFAWSPLAFAAYYAREANVRAWLARLPRGRGDVHAAAQPASSACLRALLESRADPDEGTAGGGDAFPLLAAAGGEDASLEKVDLLLEARADPNRRERPTGALRAICSGVRVAYRCGARGELATLFANASGCTALHNCSGYTCQPHIAARLLAARADADARSTIGWTPLEYAARMSPGVAVPAELAAVYEDARV